MKKLFITILCVLLLANLSLTAQPMNDTPPFGPRGEGIKNLLKLTPDQEKKFDDMAYQRKQEVIDVHAQIQKNRLELKKMLDDNKIDEKNFIRLTDENTKLQGNLKASATKHWLDVYKMLNDEQRVIWTKHLSHMTDPQFIKERVKERIRGGIRNFMMNRRQMRMNRDF